jgi:5-methylcytosine-specific restriction endonuclease McrA
MGYKDPEVQREYQRKWIRARREKWLLENGPCVDCDSWDKLEVDHVNPAEKLMNPAILWGMSPTNPKRIAELAKCQVRCFVCHKAKTFLQTYGEPEHGTTRMYNRGECRCALCRAANAEERRLYRASLKQLHTARYANAEQ